MLTLALTLALALLPTGVLPTLQEAAPIEFKDLQLSVTPPAMTDLEQSLDIDDILRGHWNGKLGSSEVEVELLAFPIDKGGFREAGGVTDMMLDWLREKSEFDVDESFEREGKYGTSPVLSVVAGRMREDGKVIGREYAACGLLPAHGYVFHVKALPEPDEAGKQELQRFFEQGIVYSGPLRDPAWTDEEALARWTKDAPDELHADFERNLSKKAWVKNAILRTEHYVVLTNASGGKKFAEQMEKNYAEIGKLFPLPSGKGCRLLPVFLFKTPDDYYAFCTKRGMELEKAKRSKGHASADYYATWYESPTDPTHIHEQTHQLFRNRLFLSGGGSWFQEGVAEYVETSKNDRNVLAAQVTKAKHMSLVELLQRESLLFSSAKDRKEGGSEASDLYTEAALFIEFLRESKWGAGKFERFLEAVGRAPRGKIEKLRAAFVDVYGVDVEAVDAEFQAYCAKR